MYFDSTERDSKRLAVLRFLYDEESGEMILTDHYKSIFREFVKNHYSETFQATIYPIGSIGGVIITINNKNLANPEMQFIASGTYYEKRTIPLRKIILFKIKTALEEYLKETK